MLLYRCENNVKQLKSDIKIGCANAYVREFNEDTDELYIYMNDMPPIELASLSVIPLPLNSAALRSIIS